MIPIDINWNRELFTSLQERLKEYAPESWILEPDGENPLTLRLVFTLNGAEWQVITELCFLELRPGTCQMQVYSAIFSSLKGEVLPDLLDAVLRLNFMSPMGAFGIFVPEDQLYFKTSAPLDMQKDSARLQEDIHLILELHLAIISNAFPVLNGIWTGSLTCEEADEKGMFQF